MMKLRNRSYVKYSTYALIAAFMVSMTPAGAMADVTVGDSFSMTGDVGITGTTTVTGTLNASGARVKLGDTVANSLAANSLFIDKGLVGTTPINVGKELNKLGDVLGTDYDTPTFNTLTATGETTLGATTADSLTIGGTDIGVTVDRHTGDIASNTAQIATNTAQIATNTGEIGKIGAVLGADYKKPEFESLKVTGETTLGGALTANAGATVAGGLLTANAGATVEGGLTADTADVTGDAKVGGNLDVTGDLSAANGTFGTKVEVGPAGNNTVIENGTVTATGPGKFGSLEAGGLKVNGATELNGALKVNNNVDATGTIHAVGNIRTDGNISAVDGTFSGDVSAKDGTFQDAVIDNDLKVKHDATIDGTLSAGAGKVVADSSGLTVGNKVTVGAPSSPQTTIENGDIMTDGALTADGGALINNGLEVNGDAAFNDNASIGNDLTVGNNANITNDLTVGNNASIGGTLDVTGNTTLGGTLDVTGNATFASNATVGGKLTANGGLEVTGDAAFNDNATIERNLTVKGESSLEGKVTIGTGNQTIINGDTVETGRVNTGTVNTDFANVDEKLTVGTAEGNQTFVKGSKITSEAGEQGTTVIDGGKLTVSKPVTTRTPGDDKTEIDGGNITATGKGTFGSLQVNGDANIGGDATVDGKLYANEGGVFSNSTVINGDGMEISENGTIAAYYGKYGMQVGRLTYDGMRNTLNVGGGTITGLADGGVYRGSSDAVTGNQLWQAYQRMDDLQESINIVGAHAAALSGLAPVPYNPYQPTTLSAAIGTYRDEYAVAVGVYHYVRDNVMFNLGASICSDGDLMGRAGISFAVGKKDKDKPALAQNMNDVQKQLMEVQYALQELKDENAALKKQLRKQ